MNDSIYRITLDMHTVASQIQLNAKHHDKSRSMYITLMENGSPYVIAEGCKAVLTIKRPDGYMAINDCAIIYGDSKVFYEFSNFSTSKIGIYECELRLADSEDELITSPRFTILVDETLYDSSDTEIIYHSDLASRDADDQHPISAITGLADLLNAENPVSVASASVVAQLPKRDGYYSTVFCIATINNVNYGIGFYRNADDTAQIGVVYNIATGTLLGEKNYTTLGHVNDAVYDAENNRIIVACYQGGNIAYIPFDGTLGNATLVDLENGLVAGCGCVDDKIYVLFGPATVKVYDSEFTLEKTITLAEHHTDDQVYQSMYVDKDYIYRSKGRPVSKFNTFDKKSPFEAVDVFLHNGTFVHRVLIPTSYELESIDRLGDEFYACCATSNRSLIYKCNIMETDRTYDIIPSSVSYVGVNVATLKKVNHVNESYDGFIIDGTEDHPYSSWYHAVETVPDYINSLEIVLDSNLSTYVTIRKLRYKLTVSSTVNAHIPGFYVDSGEYVRINGITFVDLPESSSSYPKNALFAAYYSKSVVVENCVFDGTAEATLYMYGGDIYVYNCQFKKRANGEYGELVITSGASARFYQNTYTVQARLYSVGAGYLRIGSSDIPNFMYATYATNDNPTTIGSDVDVAQIRMGGRYLVETNATPSGLPSGILFHAVVVTPISMNNAIVHAIAKNGDFYMAHSSAGTISKWINVRNPEDVVEIKEADLIRDMEEVYG